MSQTNFIDHTMHYCRSGKGGAGSSHFRKEKFYPQGGPDGGDGGRGGHIILRGNRNMWTLLHLRYKKHLYADNGTDGSGQKSTGAEADDIILDVPLGTVAKDTETGEIIGEITEHDEEFVLLKGGRGGLGNWNFRTSTNQAPEYSQPGEEGIERKVTLELKLLADVGLVGFPNAGKSTLLSVVSAAKPKVANYAFTTLVPSVGVVSYYDDQSFVMADIPGIIEGASEGKGLGIRFLRHIERNAVLLFLIPVDADDINKEYEILLNELKQFNPELLDKNRVIALSKSDMLDDELQAEIEKELNFDAPYCFISSVAQKGLAELKDELWKAIN